MAPMPWAWRQQRGGSRGESARPSLSGRTPSLTRLAALGYGTYPTMAAFLNPGSPDTLERTMLGCEELSRAL